MEIRCAIWLLILQEIPSVLCNLQNQFIMVKEELEITEMDTMSEQVK